VNFRDEDIDNIRHYDAGFLFQIGCPHKTDEGKLEKKVN